MAQVSIKVSDRTYRLECDDHEKERLREIGDYFARKVDSLKPKAGGAGQDRLLLMAALTIADELMDARQQAENLDTDDAPTPKKPNNAKGKEQMSNKVSVDQMTATAELTKKLEAAAAKIKDLSGQIDVSNGQRN